MSLKGERHLRGAVGAQVVGCWLTSHSVPCQQSPPDFGFSRAELVAERAAAQLLTRGARVDTGVQSTMNAALQRDAKLRTVLALLAKRHHERLSAVEQCLQNMCHGLSAPFHSTGGDVVVREAGFAVGAERCAVCGLLEAYDVPYTYYGASGEEKPQSSYALTAEERATAAAGFDVSTVEEPATAAPG